MKKQIDNTFYFDDRFSLSERLPRQFSATFQAVGDNEIEVYDSCGHQVGDKINDNSWDNDYYRFHDIFHYTFATLLSWSPCTRAMMKRKRKSDNQIDRIEDGARATITEEAISLIIFNEAKRRNFFSDGNTVSRATLRLIKDMTSDLEVSIRKESDWKRAIEKSYEIFRLLVANHGGKVMFDMDRASVVYQLN